MEPSGGEQERRETNTGDLFLSSIEINNFRNYRHLSLNNIGRLNIFIGPNAVGKTSIVEAVQLVTALSSFRTAQVDQMVLWGCDHAYIQARMKGPRDLEETLHIQNGKRKYQLNGKPRRVQDLKGLLPAVSFCPDDLNLVKGSNSARLDAIDHVGTQLSANFYAVKKDYTKLVKQKNAALKEELPDSYLDSIEEVLVKVGAQYLSHRSVVLGRFVPLFKDYYHTIGDGHGSADILYTPSWEKGKKEDTPTHSLFNEGIFDKQTCKQKFEQALMEKRAEERARGRSVVGPHADRVSFVLNNRDAMHFASQGEQRTLVLAFKLAESAVIQNTLRQKPVLLLDDVMSELDEHRRHYFMEFVTDDIQTFITTTNGGYFDSSLLDQAAVYNLPLY